LSMGLPPNATKLNKTGQSRTTQEVDQFNITSFS
jgi:hypothetical protein